MKVFFSAMLCLFVFFAGLHAQKSDTMTDPRDGHMYKTIKIGKQWWMAENLKYSIDNPDASENIAIQDEVGYDASEGYPESSRYLETYGLYYTWEEAKNVCPAGGKLPSSDDWNKLFEEVGGKEIAGARLSSHSDLWDNPFDRTIEPTGFNIEPAGYRFYILYRLWETGNRTFFWSSTELHEYSAIGYDFHAGYSKVFGGELGYRKENAISVRCIKE